MSGSAHGTGWDPGAFAPRECVDLELTAGASSWQGHDGETLTLLRIHGQPLASVHHAGGELAAASLVDIVSALDADTRLQLLAHLRDDGADVHLATDSADDPAVLAKLVAALEPSCPQGSASRAERQLMTVVVCTLGREPLLATCLDRLLAQDHPDVEILVVDNDPESGAVRATLEARHDERLRVVAEPRRGLSFARNRGLAEARGDVVAFTDDDAVPDVSWLRRLADTFDEDPRIAGVTGLVVPLELDTHAQVLFEEFGSFDRGCLRRVWAFPERPEHSALGPLGVANPAFPFSAGVVGSGNNMSFRTARLRELGGFDPALGAGTLTGGGEDLDVFFRFLMAGDVLVYEPRAVVRHRHRRDSGALLTQTRAYGSGLSAMITKTVVTRPMMAARLVSRFPAGARRLLDPTSEKNERKSDGFPHELTRSERHGFMAGPALYARARWSARRTGGSRD